MDAWKSGSLQWNSQRMLYMSLNTSGPFCTFLICRTILSPLSRCPTPSTRTGDRMIRCDHLGSESSETPNGWCFELWIRVRVEFEQSNNAVRPGPKQSHTSGCVKPSLHPRRSRDAIYSKTTVGVGMENVVVDRLLRHGREGRMRRKRAGGKSLPLSIPQRLSDPYLSSLALPGAPARDSAGPAQSAGFSREEAALGNCFYEFFDFLFPLPSLVEHG